MKAKIRAIRYFLAQTNPELRIVREKFLNMRSFRTIEAKEVLANPFLTGHKHIYVLDRIAQWADVVFKCKWWLYSTDTLVYELKKYLLGEPYKQVNEGDVEPVYYDICLQEARNSFFKPDDVQGA